MDKRKTMQNIPHKIKNSEEIEIAEGIKEVVVKEKISLGNRVRYNEKEYIVVSMLPDDNCYIAMNEDLRRVEVKDLVLISK